MVNLLTETMECIECYGKTEDMILWIKAYGTGITIENFKTIADHLYDDGYGQVEVASDLIIMFTDNTWLEREEYDGSEGWVLKSVPVAPTTLGYVDSIMIACRDNS